VCNAVLESKAHREKKGILLMLVLSRYRDEVICIGDDIRITIVDIRGDRVRIGVEAPPSVTVDREEIHMAKKAGHKPAKTTVVNTNSVIKVRPLTAPKTAVRKEVVSMT
jgi:carbon storage regulator